jgi:hypothetical protein
LLGFAPSLTALVAASLFDRTSGEPRAEGDGACHGGTHRLPDPMSAHTKTDSRFGKLTVRIDEDDALVRVEGALIPLAELRRLDDAVPDRYSSIGSRDGAHLALCISGEPAQIAPARGNLSRKSYRVDVRHGETHYRLVPTSRLDSGLFRGGTRIATMYADGKRVSAEWHKGQRVDPVDASVGYLLAASFGTGAQHILITLLKIVLGGAT